LVSGLASFDAVGSVQLSSQRYDLQSGGGRFRVPAPRSGVVALFGGLALLGQRRAVLGFGSGLHLILARHARGDDQESRVAATRAVMTMVEKLPSAARHGEISGPGLVLSKRLPVSTVTGLRRSGT